MNDLFDDFKGVYLSNEDQDDLLTREEILDGVFMENIIVIECYRASDDVLINSFFITSTSYRDSFFICHHLEDQFPNFYFFPYILSDCDENYIEPCIYAPAG